MDAYGYTSASTLPAAGSSGMVARPLSPLMASREAATTSPRPPIWSPADDASANVLPAAKLSRASKDVLFGSLSGMVAKVFEHPL